jgi:hexosaminidase
LSEVVWTKPETKNWSGFEKRMQTQYNRYRLWGSNFSTGYFDVDAAILPTPGNKGLQIKLSARDKTGKIFYSINQQSPQAYNKPVIITKPSALTATYRLSTGSVLDSLKLNIHFNKATGKKISLSKVPMKGYAEDAFTLVDGIVNEMGLSRPNEVVGYRGNNLQAIIDLGTTQSISSVLVHSLIIGGSRVYAPEVVEVFSSVDGKSYKSLSKTAEYTSPIYGKGDFKIIFPPTSARYVQLIVKPVMKIAEGRAGAGETALMFVDEIEVN